MQRSVTDLKRQLRKLASSKAKAAVDPDAPAYLKILDPNDESTFMDLSKVALRDCLIGLQEELTLQVAECRAWLLMCYSECSAAGC